MSNMSYCRFQNTLKDLQDCFNALNEEPIDELSREERSSAEDILILCQEFIEEHQDKIEEYKY